jgi:hypothetical protein
VRNFWTTLAVTNYAASLSVSRETYEDYLRELRDLGLDAWHLLFGYRTKAGASETLGAWIKELDPDEGALLQISYSPDVSDFVFPWGLLYPPLDAEPAVDPRRFWGARYRLEQVLDGSKQEHLEVEPVTVSFALDDKFGTAADEVAMFDRYAAAGTGRLLVAPPVRDSAGLQQRLTAVPPAHLVYFFCHGFAPSAPALRADLVKVMQEQIDKLPDAQQSVFATFVEVFDSPGDEPWILLGTRIKERTLRQFSFFHERMPIVFLNMCQSADLLPSMTSGLVRVFLNKSAASVVGTESPMTPVFAHAFANRVFDGLFTGEDLGTSLLKARQHFLSREVRNPLGLAYTLYGRGTVRLGRGALMPSPPAA